MTQPALRCDLHVHSVHSGRVNLPVLRHFGNDSYSDPVDVYETARLRGMDLVTLTDHDTIDGALAIAHLPGTFLSEEITCELPGGRQLHVNAFGIDETQHARISRLRFDAEALFAYLREEGIAASVNHLFSAVTGPRELADIALALQSVRLIEVRNGRYARTTADVVRNFGGGYRELAPRAGAGAADLARFAALVTATILLPLVPLVTGALQVRDLLFPERVGNAWRVTFQRAPRFRPMGTAASAEGGA